MQEYAEITNLHSLFIHRISYNVKLRNGHSHIKQRININLIKIPINKNQFIISPYNRSVSLKTTNEEDSFAYNK